MTKKLTLLSLDEKLLVGILLLVFGGIVLHAPLSVWLGSLLSGNELLIKSWKEMLLGSALILMMVVVSRRQAWDIYQPKLFWLIGTYAALHLLLVPFFPSNLEQIAAGLLINLRFLLFFGLVYGVLSLFPQLRRLFVTIFFAGAVLVVGFALLQATVLPPDLLRHIGYGPETIMPFLTVDQNMDYIRINSTLRGPNPLGAYAGIVLAVVTAYWLLRKSSLNKKTTWLLGALTIASGVALWASYSRSALVAATVAVLVVLALVFAKRLSKVVILALGVVALTFSGGLYAARDSDFVSHVILHEDPTEGNDVNSNDGHVESLIDGTDRLLRQPFGAGVGSTGSASLLGDKPLIIENQYLFTAHETGWLGLGLFLAIFVAVMRRLFARRKDWLALGVFASGVGLALIGLLLPVWVDDTVAIIWWGLAGVALCYYRGKHG